MKGKTAKPVESFQFGRHELPVRLAHIIREIDLLPKNLLKMPSVELVRSWWVWLKFQYNICTLKWWLVLHVILDGILGHCRLLLIFLSHCPKRYCWDIMSLLTEWEGQMRKYLNWVQDIHGLYSVWTKYSKVSVSWPVFFCLGWPNSVSKYFIVLPLLSLIWLSDVKISWWKVWIACG